MMKQTFNFKKEDQSSFYYAPTATTTVRAHNRYRHELSLCRSEVRDIFGIDKKRKQFTMTISDQRMLGAKLIRFDYADRCNVRWSFKCEEGFFGYDVDQFLIRDLKRPKQLYVKVA